MVSLLIVDDSDINLEVAEGLLQLLGHTAVTVNSGPAAIERLRAEKFDAVFMDLEMPEMDGLATTRMIRAEEAKLDKHTPILAMSAHVLSDVQEQCRQAGMDGFISKPVQPEEIRSALEKITSMIPSDSGYIIL